MEDVIVRRRSQWTVDFRWCWRQSGRGLTWMDNCRCRGTAGAGVVSYHHERWIMIIKFFQWVPFAHSFELGWHASVLFFWVRKLAPCITCLQYSAIWVGLLQIRQEEVGKRWDKYNIYIIYIYLFRLRILLQSSSCHHGAFSACKGCAWHFPIRMVTSHWHPRWWNRRTGHDRTFLVESDLSSVMFSDISRISDCHSSIACSCEDSFLWPGTQLVDFPASEAIDPIDFRGCIRGARDNFYHCALTASQRVNQGSPKSFQCIMYCMTLYCNLTELYDHMHVKILYYIICMLYDYVIHHCATCSICMQSATALKLSMFVYSSLSLPAMRTTWCNMSIWFRSDVISCCFSVLDRSHISYFIIICNVPLARSIPEPKVKKS